MNMRTHLQLGPSYGFRPAAILTILTGILLHSTALLIGREQFQDVVYTPLFDLFFAFPMTYAAVAGWRNWRRVVHATSIHRWFYRFIVVYFTVSVAVHLRGLMLWDTSYVQDFPVQYSLYLLPSLCAVLLFLWRLRFYPDEQ